MSTKPQHATSTADNNAERVVLSSLLDGFLGMHEVLELFPGELHEPATEPVFASNENQMVWLAALRVHRLGLAVNPTTVRSELGDGLAGAVGGYTDNGDAFGSVRILKRRWIIRRALRVLIESRGALLQAEDAEEAIATAAASLVGIIDGDRDGRPRSVADIHAQEIAILEHYAGGGGPGGILTGFRILDEAIGGLLPGQLATVAAGTSQGKSVFMLDLAIEAALVQRIPTLIFSLEMPGRELLMRMWAQLTRVPLAVIRNNTMSAADFEKITRCQAQLASCPLSIDDRPSANVAQISARAKAFAARNPGLGLVVVDYLQRMNGLDPRDTEERQTTQKAKGLKTLARELSIPVLTASQVNEKELRHAKDRRPRISDMKHANGIAEESDLIFGIFRNDAEDPPGHEMAILKQRSGPTLDYFHVSFAKALASFRATA